MNTTKPDSNPTQKAWVILILSLLACVQLHGAGDSDRLLLHFGEVMRRRV